jgi:flagellar biosynthetic protein FliR
MQIGELVGWVLSVLLVSLRVAPVFALAPPFNLMPVPMLLRVVLGLGLSACLISTGPAAAALGDISAAHLVVAAASELMLGATFVLAFQIVFGALYFAGRTIDIQAGYGLATLVDPTSQASTPMIGTLFAYAFALVFFALNGHGELLRIMAASLDAIPIGEGQAPGSLAHLTAFISTVFVVALGVAGGAILCLFLADLGVALLSRTAPQMNALVFGFQVKTLLLLAILPTTFAFAGALLARLARVTLEALPGLL